MSDKGYKELFKFESGYKYDKMRSTAETIVQVLLMIISPTFPLIVLL